MKRKDDDKDIAPAIVLATPEPMTHTNLQAWLTGATAEALAQGAIFSRKSERQNAKDPTLFDGLVEGWIVTEPQWPTPPKK